MKNLFLTGLVLSLAACTGSNNRSKPEAGWEREAKFRQFLTVSVVESFDSARYVLDTLLNFYREDSVAIRQMDAFLTPPLSDPNSQTRNDELYILLLQEIIASPFYDSVEKIRPRYQLDMAMKNRVGRMATDFEYTLANGKRGTLYQVEAPFTLVYIHNPDCYACGEILELLSSSYVIINQLNAKKLKILAIYPDEDLTVWRKHLKEMPTEWISGHDADQTLREQELYDLRAIPSLYLLDKNKTVLLKDCASVDMIEAYLVQYSR